MVMWWQAVFGFRHEVLDIAFIILGLTIEVVYIFIIVCDDPSSVRPYIADVGATIVLSIHTGTM